VASRGRSQPRRGGGRRWFRRGGRKHCVFCADKSTQIDYKQVDMLRGFLTDRGKIQPRRRTGTCAKHQRQLATAIKRARHLAMLPFVVEADRR
jgi:small subunit ribosomal protein S18